MSLSSLRQTLTLWGGGYVKINHVYLHNLLTIEALGTSIHV